MQQAVEELAVSFDVPRILGELETVIYADPAFDMEKFLGHNQISLRESTDWFDGIGSLYDYDQKKFVATTEQYDVPCKKLVGTYLEKVISKVEEVAKQDGVKIGRIRVMRIAPKTCYSLHIDPEEFRYHIPLETSYQSFFVVDTNVVRMPTVGRLYRFKTNSEHTAVNASFKVRLHIVFDTYV
jgi:hypothetical protein